MRAASRATREPRNSFVTNLLPTGRVYAYLEPADMRKSFSVLSGIVEQELGQQFEAALQVYAPQVRRTDHEAAIRGAPSG